MSLRDSYCGCAWNGECKQPATPACPWVTSPTVTEPGSVREPSTVDSGCSSKVQPSVCIRCGTVIWTGGIHLNGHTECDMWEVEVAP